MRKQYFRFLVALTAALILLISSLEIAAQKKPRPRTRKFSALQKKEIDRYIREYLLKNPTILREANEALLRREEQEKQRSAAKNVKLLGSEIFEDPNTPVGGNPKGDVTVAVFFDYYCGYCKRNLPHLAALIEKDPNVRIVYKEFPILSPQSQTAARAALAASRQGKYDDFHKALVGSSEVNEDIIKTLAATNKIDYPQLQKDMSDPRIDAELVQTAAIATSLGIEGTPAYVIGNHIFPGAVELDTLIKYIEQERIKSKASAKK